MDGKKLHSAFQRLLSIFPVISIRAGSAATSYLSQLLIARFFVSDHDFGLYALFLTAVNLASIFLKGGLDTATIKYISFYRSIKDVREHSFMVFSYGYIFVSIFILWFLMSFDFTRAAISLVGLPANDKHIGFVVFSILALSIGQIQRASIVAKKHPIASEWHNGVVRPLLTTLLVFLFNCYDGSPDYLIVAQSYTLSVLISSIIGGVINGYYSERSELNYFLVFNLIKENATSWLRTSLFMSVNVILRQVFKSADIFFCGYFLGAKYVAYYAAATRIADLVVFGLSSTNMIFAPKISERFHGNDFKGLQDIVRSSSRLVFFLGLLFFIFILFFGYFLLGFFGENYRVAYGALLVLSLGQLINSYYGPIGYLASMTGNERKLTKIIILISPVVILIYIILIPFVGIAGAAIGSAFGTIGWNVFLDREIRRVIDIDSRAYLWRGK